MNDWGIAFFPLLGVAVGAGLQFIASRANERDRQVNQLRDEAYADYLRAVAASAHLRSDDDLVEALKAAADAKARIVVYGASEVIAALARFEGAGSNLTSESSVVAFVALIGAMRPGRDVSEKEIMQILLGNRE